MTASSASTLFSVAGKNVLVTGGSRGIGYMIAKGFSEHGANVLLTSRDEKACKSAAEKLNCQYVTSTLANRRGCEDLAAQVSDRFGDRLDVLVNNAGTSWGEPLERDSSERSNWGFDKVLDLNVKGIFYLTRACLPMLERTGTAGDPSRVINIGSVAGLIPQQAPTHAYDVSKAAVHHLTRKFAGDFAPRNVTVNCLAPGYVPSRMSDGLAAWGADKDALAAATPLRRLGGDDDVAGPCIFLASRAGAWCTGLILYADGGVYGAGSFELNSKL